MIIPLVLATERCRRPTDSLYNYITCVGVFEFLNGTAVISYITSRDLKEPCVDQSMGFVIFSCWHDWFLFMVNPTWSQTSYGYARAWEFCGEKKLLYIFRSNSEKGKSAQDPIAYRVVGRAPAIALPATFCERDALFGLNYTYSTDYTKIAANDWWAGRCMEL